MENKIFSIRTTANREDQVMDFLSSNVQKKKLEVYAIIRPHGMRDPSQLDQRTMTKILPTNPIQPELKD